MYGAKGKDRGQNQIKCW